MPTPLETLLKQQIAATGPLTVEEYMEACLYHPQHGYYTNGRNFLPYNPTTLQSDNPYPHDFTTAPELTPHFGATLANWVAKQWQPLNQPFTLMEAGPGRGSLMLSLLTHLQAAHPACYAAAQPVLIETSPALTHLQHTTLKAFPECQWAPTPTPLQSYNPIILLANELLDAFPHQQLIEHNGRIQPRTISLNAEGNLAFTDTLNPETLRVTEHSPQMRTWLQSLPATLHAALFADYGTETDAPTGDTLQALHRHQKVSVFHLPGETDLTTHVNFTNVQSALSESHPHLQAEPLEHLAPFLMRHGLASLALGQSDAGGTHPVAESALHRLLHPTQMGTLFKVKCFTPIAP